MGAVSIGPLAIPLARLLLLASIAGMLALGAWWGRRRQLELEQPLWHAVLIGFSAARLGYVLPRWDYFGAQPLEILVFWRGGYAPWIGIGAAMLFATLRARSARLRRPLLTLLAGTVLVWAGASWIGGALQKGGPALPELTLETLEREPVALGSYRGQPTVVNLWASWCPPCRREMPLLARAQQDNPDVHFVFANQGEQADQVRGFLASQQLQLDNVLLDPFSKVGQASGSRALPTTLFYDAEGRLVDSHLGEVSAPRLTDYLDALGAGGN